MPAGLAANAAARSRWTVSSTLVVMPHMGHGTPVTIRSGHGSPGWPGSAGRMYAAASIAPPTRVRSRPGTS